MPLQGSGMAGLLTDIESGKGGILLQELRLQIGARIWAGWRRVEAVDRNAERITFQSGIQIVILCGAMVDAEARAENCFSMQCAGSPRQGQPRIEIDVTGVVQARVRGTRRGIGGAGTRRYVERSGPKAHSVKHIYIEHRRAVGRLVGDAVIIPA